MKLLGGMRVRWLAVLPLVALLGCLAVSTVFYRIFEVCDPASRAAMTQFEAFGDTDIDPDPDYLNSAGDCSATFTTTAPADQVNAYYRQQLSSHGWVVRSHGQGVAGKRGALCYYVGPGGYDPPGSRSLRVKVMRTDSGSKFAPVGQC